MNKATVLYELENGLLLRDGDIVSIITNDKGMFSPQGEYSGRIEVSEDAIWIKDNVSNRVIKIPFEYVEDVVKMG